MNYKLFSKIVGLTKIFSIDYKNNLLLEAKDYSSSELRQIIEFIYSEEERIYLENDTIKFQEYKEPILKNNSQIKNIKKSGKYLNKLLKILQKSIRSGISLLDIEKIATNFLKQNNIISSFKGVDGYKYNIYFSVNNKIIHNIPNNYKLKDGDLITIDAGVNYYGGITDSAFSMIVGGNNNNYIAWKMLYVLKTTLDKYIKNFKPGYNMYDFSFNFYNDIVGNGLNIIKNSSGHCVGVKLHEEPYIYNWPCEYMKNIILKPGMILAIEPLITGNTRIVYFDKGNIGYTKKQDIGCYFEYTILITNDGYEIISGFENILIPDVNIEYKNLKINIGNKLYNLLISDTKEKRNYGLMFRENLEDNKGMLFLFNKTMKVNFTMNHTFIDLDIIGLNKNNEVVFIKENVKNYFDVEYKEIINNDIKIKYVIELNAGEVSNNGIKIKDIINL